MDDQFFNKGLAARKATLGEAYVEKTLGGRTRSPARFRRR